MLRAVSAAGVLPLFPKGAGPTRAFGAMCLPSTSSAGGMLKINTAEKAKSRQKHDFVPMKDWDFQKDYNETNKFERFDATPDKWDYYNAVVWPPNWKLQNGQPMQGEVYHYRENIKYSWRKMWIICHLVKSMTVDEALKQLQFQYRKGAAIAAEVLQEAVDKAVSEHNVEYKSNLYIADMEAKQSLMIKGVRKHARGRYGIVKYRYCHLFVHLKEGPPPSFKGRAPEKTGWDKMEDYVRYMRERRIKYPL